ncbi:hypothetical protein AAE478_010063 [Parahypoxylon ruwenzoriense]
MVSLDAIQASNGRIAAELPTGLVAVFVGATSGIGETSLKQFVKHAKQPRIYFVGRSDEAADRIKAELKTLNSDGEYNFLKCDVSLLQNVDQACREIKTKVQTINLLFISTGTLATGTKTQEGLHVFTALVYYSRIRFVVNLLPLLKDATSLRRVVTVFAGTKEGPLFPNDWEGYNLGFAVGRGHFASMLTLAFEALAPETPEVSFVHVYPGFVKTGISRGSKGIAMAITKALFKVIGPFVYIPLVEVGERQVFCSTSARFPTTGRIADGVPLTKELEEATSTDGKTGGGVYSIDYEAEPCDKKVLGTLAGLRKDGLVDELWKHTQDEFMRITQSLSI